MRQANPNYVAFPKWIYASGGRKAVVNSVEEMQQDRFEGWVESPADIVEPTAAAPTPTASTPSVVASLVSGSDTLLKRFYTVPAKTIADQIVALPDLDAVREVRDMEEQRPGGPRKGVMQAVLSRMEQLAAAIEEDAVVQ